MAECRVWESALLVPVAEGMMDEDMVLAEELRVMEGVADTRPRPLTA